MRNSVKPKESSIRVFIENQLIVAGVNTERIIVQIMYDKLKETFHINLLGDGVDDIPIGYRQPVVLESRLKRRFGSDFHVLC